VLALLETATGRKAAQTKTDSRQDAKATKEKQPAPCSQVNLRRGYPSCLFAPLRETVLTAQKFSILMFHFGTSRWGGMRKLPRAFTEQAFVIGGFQCPSRIPVRSRA